MKKVILTLVIGAFLTSCGGWSCKKRYCKTQKKDIKKTEVLSTAKKEVLVTP